MVLVDIGLDFVVVFVSSNFAKLRHIVLSKPPIVVVKELFSFLDLALGSHKDEELALGDTH